MRQGVSVGVANAGFKACSQDYAAGSYVIDMAQPTKRLLRTLLDADVPMDSNFLAASSSPISRRSRPSRTWPRTTGRNPGGPSDNDSR